MFKPIKFPNLLSLWFLNSQITKTKLNQFTLGTRSKITKTNISLLFKHLFTIKAKKITSLQKNALIKRQQYGVKKKLSYKKYYCKY